jgi:hypothetical protein
VKRATCLALALVLLTGNAFAGEGDRGGEPGDLATEREARLYLLNKTLISRLRNTEDHLNVCELKLTKREMQVVTVPAAPKVDWTLTLVAGGAGLVVGTVVTFLVYQSLAR